MRVTISCILIKVFTTTVKVLSFSVVLMWCVARNVGFLVAFFVSSSGCYHNFFLFTSTVCVTFMSGCYRHSHFLSSHCWRRTSRKTKHFNYFSKHFNHYNNSMYFFKNSNNSDLN